MPISYSVGSRTSPEVFHLRQLSLGKLKLEV